MRKHILLIDSLTKLSLSKDTSLLLALTLKEHGHEVSLLFEEDFYYDNGSKPFLKTYDFDGQFASKVGYLESFTLTNEKRVEITHDTTFHFRLDPPFDTRYLRYLWMLKGLQDHVGLRVINDPGLVCQHNEKMIAYTSEDAVRSYVGSSEVGFNGFLNDMKEQGMQNIILKPLDLYQGIGVEKVDIDHALDSFKKKCIEYQGAVVAQPFLKEVETGEKRSIFFAGKHLGSILKVPPKDNYLANIAQGATFDACSLTGLEERSCHAIVKQLDPTKVPWIAFDLLGEKVQEANITCPGLLVEVSYAVNKNLAIDLVNLLN